MRKGILLIMMILCQLAAMAETVIDGNVVEAISGKPVAAANVMVKNGFGRLLGFASSDENGSFSIKLKDGSTENLTISASMLGYRNYSAPLVCDGKRVTISMEDGAIELKEVVVKADQIRENGDTITYNVGSFAQKQDRTIGDVLKRMPGIDVANNGKIQYQGTDINKFYIEGNDLLGGKYGIATNGISHEDIGAVEVINVLS